MIYRRSLHPLRTMLLTGAILGAMFISDGVTREAQAACTAADIVDDDCGSVGPCTITRNVTIDDGCVLDFGTRDVIVDNGKITIGENAVVLKTGSFTVTRRGDIAGNGSVGGSFTVLAAGHIAVERQTSQTGNIRMLGTAMGGAIALEAAGDIRINGVLRADNDNNAADASGGSIRLDAGGDIAIEVGGPIKVSAQGGSQATGGSITLLAGGRVDIGEQLEAVGGNGGIVQIRAGGDVVIDDTLKNSAIGRGGNGGRTAIHAGANIVINEPLANHGPDANVGGNGGEVTLDAGGDITVRKQVTTRSGPDAGGGVIEATAGGSIHTQASGELNADGNGLLSVAGELRLFAGIDVLVTSQLRTSGGIAGGRITIDAGRDMTISALVDAGSSALEGTGGQVVLQAGRSGTGHLTVASDIDVSGTPCNEFSECGIGGSADLTACDLLVEFDATIDASVGGIGQGAEGGAINLSARRQLTVNGQVTSTAAATQGQNIIERRGDMEPVVAAGAIDPPPTDIIRTICTGSPEDLPTCLTPCPTCGDNGINFPETCDDGAPASCDGCSILCQVEDCDDGNPCTADPCLPTSGCRNTPVADDTPCLDDTVCNGAEACASGECEAGVPVDCSDDNDCTHDPCDPASGCGPHDPVPPGAPCDDGDLCTAGDACNAAGLCAAGAPADCDDDEVCTDDSCDPATGCAHDVFGPLGEPCEADGDLCTGDACLGTCVVGEPISCDDENLCTTDSCDPASGCTHDAIPGCVPPTTTVTTTSTSTTTTVTTTTTSPMPSTTTTSSTLAPTSTTSSTTSTSSTVVATTTTSSTSPTSSTVAATSTTTSTSPTSSTPATTTTSSSASPSSSTLAATSTTAPATSTTTTTAPPSPAVAPECVIDTDCADANICTRDICAEDACLHLRDGVACPIEGVPAKRLTVRAPAKPKKNKLLFNSRGTFTTPRASDDPTRAGGLLEIRDASGQHVTFNLDAGLWKRLGGKGFRYKDKKRQAGPCTKVTFKTGKSINLACGGSAMALRTPLVSPVELVLSLGNSSYCAVFGGRITHGPGRFDARAAAKPSSCPLAQGTP